MKKSQFPTRTTQKVLKFFACGALNQVRSIIYRHNNYGDIWNITGLCFQHEFLRAWKSYLCVLWYSQFYWNAAISPAVYKKTHDCYEKYDVFVFSRQSLEKAHGSAVARTGHACRPCICTNSKEQCKNQYCKQDWPPRSVNQFSHSKFDKNIRFRVRN